jgi:hypothetical protein
MGSFFGQGKVLVALFLVGSSFSLILFLVHFPSELRKNFKWEIERYSSRFCVGLPFPNFWGLKVFSFNGYHHDLDCRHCKFQNICFDSKGKNFVYFRDPIMRGIPMFYDLKAVPRFEYPKCFIRCRGPRLALSGKKDDRYCFSPRVAYEHIPENVTWLPLENYVLFPWVRHFGNFGHFWNEWALPLYMIQSIFRVVTMDSGIVWTPETEELGSVWEKDRSSSRYIEWLSALTPWPPIHLKEYNESEDINPSLMCFKNLLVGDQCLEKFPAYVPSFPKEPGSFVWRSALSKTYLKRPFKIQKDPKITLMWKTGRRIPKNYEEVRVALKRSFPHVPVSISQSEKTENFSVQDEIKLLQETTVLITPTGGMSHLACFLGLEAAVVVFSDFQYNSAFEANVPSLSFYAHFSTFLYQQKKEYYEPNSNNCSINCDYQVDLHQLTNIVAEILNLQKNRRI